MSIGLKGCRADKSDTVLICIAVHMHASHALGKPIGNGFPMGAVVMSATLARGFDNGMQYFATCGGCTASGAAGMLHRASFQWLRVPSTLQSPPTMPVRPSKAAAVAVKAWHMQV
jgi:hypothetical protein